jgi:hypothetical protein
VQRALPAARLCGCRVRQIGALSRSERSRVISAF